jgi:flagellar motor switch protein FliN/FliY
VTAAITPLLEIRVQTLLAENKPEEALAAAKSVATCARITTRSVLGFPSPCHPFTLSACLFPRPRKKFRQMPFTPAGGCDAPPIYFWWIDCNGLPQEVRMPVLTSQSRQASAASNIELDRILQLQVPVIVRLAGRKLALSEVMRLGQGSIIEFFKRSDEPLELLVNNRVIALGEAVKVGENFGLRITQIGDTKSVVRSMGGPG